MSSYYLSQYVLKMSTGICGWAWSYLYIQLLWKPTSTIGLISSFSNFITSLRLVRFFRLIAPRWPSTAAGAVSLKYLIKREEVRKGADQAIYKLGIQIRKWKFDFNVVALNVGCRNIYWALYLKQILIWWTCLVTPGMAVLVLHNGLCQSKLELKIKIFTFFMS